LNYNITPKDYITGGLAYLDKAFEWGLKHGIAILVGMHAAPGSQNGNDHSSPVDLGQVSYLYRSSSTKFLTKSLYNLFRYIGTNMKRMWAKQLIQWAFTLKDMETIQLCLASLSSMNQHMLV